MKIFQFFPLFGKPFKMMKNTTTWPTGHLKCEYFPILVRNIQKCETSKNDTIFHDNSPVWKFQFFFSTFWKAFQHEENHHQRPQDTWNMNIYGFGWEMCKNVKLSKVTFFDRSTVMKIFIFFDFLESLLNWWKTPPHDHRTLEMWIFTHLGEKYAKTLN